MYEINVHNCVGHYWSIFRNLVLMVRKLLWTAVKSIFLIQYFIRFFNSSTFLAVHLCIQLTTIVRKNLQSDDIVVDLSNYPFFR
jgi:hypothetical protein